jgi:acetyl-CoA acetyltransferase
MIARDVLVAGAGMHQWGKWGRPFVEYGVVAARAALQEAGIAWNDVQFVAGAQTIRNGYPGHVAGATFAQAMGWNGAKIVSTYAACASGSQAIDAARTRILAGLCDVALVVGADTTPKGFLAPTGGDRPDDPDWLRFRLIGATNPTYFAMEARRRMDLYGMTDEDLAAVKVKNSKAGASNPNARYQKAFTAEDVLASPMVSDPLRLLHICATSDGGAALVLVSRAYAQRHGITGAPRVAAVSTATPTYPNVNVELPDIATDSAAVIAPPTRGFRKDVVHQAYEEAGLGPSDVSLAEVYDLSSAMELSWIEDCGFAAEGEAEIMLRAGDTQLGGRLPVNVSGGLGAFGEAVPAQAIAQVCELVWQVRGDSGPRQVEGARVGITANQGLFGHGSSVVISRD